jgi:hypothetical protein
VKPTRREFLLGGLALAALAREAQAGTRADPTAPHRLWHASNAKREVIPPQNDIGIPTASETKWKQQGGAKDRTFGQGHR